MNVVITALESNLQIQRGFVDNLSIKYLKQKHVKVIQTNGALRRLGRVEQLLSACSFGWACSLLDREEVLLAGLM